MLSQNWAERKRHLLVIVPANLRKQWSQEMADKFFLPSMILETRSFNDADPRRQPQPFPAGRDRPLLLPVRAHQGTVSPPDRLGSGGHRRSHRLRNVYKNTSKIAIAIKQAVAPFPKVLLTATPLQNSLLELYGLVSIIDDSPSAT